MKILRPYLLAIAVLLVSACSAAPTVYNNINWFAQFYIDDYVTLTRDQKKRLDVKIEKWHAWHRSSELVKYKADLVSLRQNLRASPFNAEQWLMVFSKARNHLFHFRDEIALEAAEIIQQLSDSQINELLALWSERDTDEFDTFTRQGTAGEIEERQSKTEKRITQYIGKLSTRQSDMIRLYSIQTESTVIGRMAYNLKLRTAVKQLLAERSSPEFPVKFTSFIKNLQIFKSQSLLAAEQYNKNRYAELLEDLNESLDNNQKRKLLKKLDDYIEIIDDLSVSPIK